MDEKIKNGAFQIARQLFDSELWIEKPSSWKIIWIYILGKVNHQDNKQFERGEGFFNFSQELKQIGRDITYDMIRHSMTYFKRNGMLSTTKSTRGIIVKVLKYNKFQKLENYKIIKAQDKAEAEEVESTSNSTILNLSTTKSTIKAQNKTVVEEGKEYIKDIIKAQHKAQPKHNESTTINKNVKNANNVKTKEIYKEKFKEIYKSYPNRDSKKKAEEHFNASIKTEKDWQDIKTALVKYKKHLTTEKWLRPKSASTWFNNWIDWVDYIEPTRTQEDKNWNAYN